MGYFLKRPQVSRIDLKNTLYFPSSTNGSAGSDFTQTEEKTTSLRPSIFKNFYWKIGHQMAPFRVKFSKIFNI